MRRRWSSTPADQKTHAAGAFAHPCGEGAARPSTTAGYEYELKTVGGYRLMPWTWGSRDEDRAEVKKLSGTNEVPILVLDDGEVISGSGDDRELGARSTPAGWRRRRPRGRAASD